MPPKKKAGGDGGAAPAAAAIKELDAGKVQGSSYKSRFARPKASGVTCSDPRMVSFVVEELKKLANTSEEGLLAKIAQKHFAEPSSEPTGYNQAAVIADKATILLKY